MSCPVGKHWRHLDVNTSTRIQIVPFYVSARNVACLPREHICLLNAGSLNRLLLKLLFHQFSFIFIFEILTLWWSVRFHLFCPYQICNNYEIVVNFSIMANKCGKENLLHAGWSHLFICNWKRFLSQLFTSVLLTI